ncbi:MAG: tRNA glutamyl-Q(34) synthetase GluQRS [Acidobacteriaceae bacterium]
MTTPYIGRLAPSPTGLLHLGHAATFLTACTRARKHNGTLLLRNEDLDPQRSRSEFVAAMLEDLAWLGITWDPPMLSQSQRLPAYRAAFEQLLASGYVYPCTCTRRDLAQMTQAPHEDPNADPHPDDEPIYSGRCRPAHPTPQTLTAANYRFRVPDGETIRFLDANLGPQAFTAGIAPESAFGDFLIWRRPLTRDPDDIGLPSYQLACVVDDAHQRITEVVRGADLLKSTARQILLQRALGLSSVAYFHTALVRDQQGVRLAKRHDALAIRTLRNAGLTPAEVLARLTTPT